MASQELKNRQKAEKEKKEKKEKKEVADKIKEKLWDFLHPKDKESLKTPPETFTDVLNSGDDTWREKFEAWAIASQRGESVHFLRAVEAYKAASSGEERAEALVDIVSRYVIDGCDEPVNIDEALQEPLIEAMQACLSDAGAKEKTGKLAQIGVTRITTPDLFDEAYWTVVTDMIEGLWGKFKLSLHT